MQPVCRKLQTSKLLFYNWIFNNYKKTQMHFSANSFVLKRVNQRTEIFFCLKSFFSKEKEKRYKVHRVPSREPQIDWNFARSY